MEMDRISVTVTGQSRVDLAGKLRAFADNLDGTPAGADGKVTKSAKTTKSAPGTDTREATEPTDDSDDFAQAAAKTKSTKAAKAAAASFEDGDDEPAELETETETAEDEGDFMEAAPAKTKGKAAAKKLTVNDVNDACKAKAQATDRKTVLGILKKKFNVASVTELKADQYADVVKAMAV